MWRFLMVILLGLNVFFVQASWDTEDYGLDGALVMVVQGEQIIYLESLGQNAAGKDFDLSAAYDLGWAAEPFVSLLVMQQAERRRLAPDSQVTQVLPRFSLVERPNATAATTITRLMTHSAGLGEGDFAPLEPVPPRLNFEPEFFAGARYSYCRICVGLQTDLLEEVTQKSLAELMAQEIFYPLQMDESYIRDGRLFSTPADLAKWMSVQLQKGRWQGVQLVKPETLALTHRAWLPTGRHLREYAGYGWVVSIENGLQVVDKTEDRIITARDVGNYQAQISLIPAYNLGVLILTDQPNTGLDPLMEAILAKFADFTPPSYNLPTRPDLLAGKFRAEDGPQELEISWDGEGYLVRSGAETQSARWVEERVLGLTLEGRKSYLFFPEAGRSRTLLLTQDGRTSLFNRRD